MAHLVAIAGPSAGKRYELDKECVLGRSFNSDVYVGDLNVSRRHARIICADGGGRPAHVIEDLGSGNGTFVNEIQVARRTLQAHDIIRVGGSSFRYEQDRQARWGAEVQTMIADLIDRVPTRDSVAALTIGSDSVPEIGIAAPATEQPLDALTDGRALKMLESMYAVADAIATELDLDKLLIKVLDHLFDVFPQAERGFVLLANEQTGQLVPEAVKQRHGRREGLTFSQTMVDQVMEGGKGVIRGSTIPPRSMTRPAKPEASAAVTGQVTPKMGAPLRCRNEVLGTLHLEGKPSGAPFSQDDLALLSAIARQAAVALANARAGQALLTQQRLEADLQLARKIQQSFLPRRLPQIAGLEFFTHYLPALHVGGDFYDIMQLDPARIGIIAGDISGKGVSAALLMAKLTSDIRYLSRSCETPAEILTQANRALMAAEQDAMFATVLFVMLDLDARTFTVSNAGHQPPLVCSSRFEGTSELDDATGVALGVVPDMLYQQEVYELVPGDVVLLYSDGVNEAMNRHHEEYGMQRQRAAMLAGPAQPALVVQRVIADVRRFVGSSPQSDDQTLVAFGLVDPELTGPIRIY